MLEIGLACGYRPVFSAKRAREWPLHLGLASLKHCSAVAPPYWSFRRACIAASLLISGFYRLIDSSQGRAASDQTA
jgi:hypothetical protein